MEAPNVSGTRTGTSPNYPPRPEEGASDEQIMESLWVAAERCPGGACTRAAIAFEVLDGDRS